MRASLVFVFHINPPGPPTVLQAESLPMIKIQLSGNDVRLEDAENP
jgi:hypothetical protein